jgi:hypothetical protein
VFRNIFLVVYHYFINMISYLCNVSNWRLAVRATVAGVSVKGVGVRGQSAVQAVQDHIQTRDVRAHRDGQDGPLLSLKKDRIIIILDLSIALANFKICYSNVHYRRRI